MAKDSGGNISSLFRQAGQDAKSKAIEVLEKQPVAERPVGFNGRPHPKKPHIFDVLEYIESDWGLGMTLYPVQRFIVKLYYHLALDNTKKTIEIKDRFATEVRYRFTELEYLQFLYDEGRCNIREQDHERRELILAIGRRGGKCLNGCSVVLTRDGFVEIQGLGDPNGPEYQPLQVDVAQEGATRSTSAFFYNGGVRDTIRVRSRCGYEIEGTPNHRVRVMGEDGVIQWRSLGDMRVGDRLGIHRATDFWPTKFVDTSSYRNGLTGRKEPAFPEVFDESWGLLLGVLVGDGTWNSPGKIEVTVGPYPEWLAQVEAIFRSTIGEPTTRLEKRTRRAHRVQFNSTRTRQFLDNLGYKLDSRADEKRVPWVIWRSPKPVVVAFLRGLFETDGSAESGGRKISFSTASPKLASEVQLLLLNFGVVCRIKSRWNNRFKKWYQHVNVLGAESVRIFAEQIGFLSERKASYLSAHIAKGNLGNKSETEAIPFQRAWCRRLLESVPKNNGNAAVGKLGWRRSLLRSALGNVIKNTTEDLSYPRLRSALAVAREVGAETDMIAHFEQILEAGYFFDYVTETTPSRCQVYDLSVPDGQSFVANGFTNHNTTLSGIFASYEVYRLLNMYHPQAYYGLPDGNRIQIISVATDKDQAGLLFNEVTSHLSRCEYFKPYIASNTLSDIKFRTPYDIEQFGTDYRMGDGRYQSLNGKASIRVTFKSCVAKGLRGAGNIVIILDEMAHFIDEGQSSAKEIYDAISPSKAAFSPKNPEDTSEPVGPNEGRTICISSPLNKTGKFYDLFHTAMKGGEGADNKIAIQAPTWEINPTVSADYYREKYHEDPLTFDTEHGANFSDRVRGWIERESDLLNCVNPALRPQSAGFPKYPHQLGLDIAVKGDGTAVVITYPDKGKIVLAYHEYWKAGHDWFELNPHLKDYSCDYARKMKDYDQLDFQEIVKWVHGLTKRFHITDGLFDRWHGMSIAQDFEKIGLPHIKSEFFTRDTSSKMFQVVKTFMLDNKLELYDWPMPMPAGSLLEHSPFISELLTLQAEQISKNMVVVEAPHQKGYHDDQSDAFVRAVWLTAEKMGNLKHLSRPNEAVRPTSGPTLQGYHMSRARKHGMFLDRVNPRAVARGMRGRGR